MYKNNGSCHAPQPFPSTGGAVTLPPMSPRRASVPLLPLWRSTALVRGLGAAAAPAASWASCCASARRRHSTPWPHERRAARLDRLRWRGASSAKAPAARCTCSRATPRSSPRCSGATGPTSPRRATRGRALARERVVTLGGRGAATDRGGVGPTSSRPSSARRSGTPGSRPRRSSGAAGQRDAARAARRSRSSSRTTAPRRIRRSGARCWARYPLRHCGQRRRARARSGASRCPTPAALPDRRVRARTERALDSVLGAGQSARSTSGADPIPGSRSTPWPTWMPPTSSPSGRPTSACAMPSRSGRAGSPRGATRCWRRLSWPGIAPARGSRPSSAPRCSRFGAAGSSPAALGAEHLLAPAPADQ